MARRRRPTPAAQPPHSSFRHHKPANSLSTNPRHQEGSACRSRAPHGSPSLPDAPAAHLETQLERCPLPCSHSARRALRAISDVLPRHRPVRRLGLASGRAGGGCVFMRKARRVRRPRPYRRSRAISKCSLHLNHPPAPNIRVTLGRAIHPKAPKVRHSIARSEGPGIRFQEDLRPEWPRWESPATPKHHDPTESRAISPPSLRYYLPGPSDRALEFWPFGPDSRQHPRCVNSSRQRADAHPHFESIKWRAPRKPLASPSARHLPKSTEGALYHSPGQRPGSSEKNAKP
jgi:hypothetical protein